MIVTVRADITWEGKNKQFAHQTEKFFTRMLKMFCEAQDVDIIKIDSWLEDGEMGDDE